MRKKRHQHGVGRGMSDQEVRSSLIPDMQSSDEEDHVVVIRGKKLVNGGGEKEQLGRTEKQLCVLLVICMIVIVCLVAYVLLMNVKLYTKTGKNAECTTPECVTNSAKIIQNMNLTADPCHDYYDYACGNWLETTTVPADKPKWTSFGQVALKNMAIMKQVLEKPGFSFKGKNSTAIQKAKDYYDACMNSSAVDLMGADPLHTVIKNLGHWSITTKDWKESSWNIVQPVVLGHRLNIHPFFYMSVSPDQKNSSSNVIKMSQSGLTLASRKEYLTQTPETFKVAYTRFFERVCVLLGVSESSQLRVKVEAVYAFEKQLAEIHVPRKNLTDPVKNYNRITVEKMTELLKPLMLDEYFKKMFKTAIPKSEIIICESIEYMESLGQLVAKTDKEVLANYAVWYVIQNLLSALPNSFREATLILSSAQSGVTALTPRWEMCIGHLTGAMSIAAGAVYIEEQFTENDKKQVLEILHYIREAFIANLPSVEWMDATTKLRAMDKAKAMLDMIGYPDWLEDPAKLDDFYERLKISENNFFLNNIDCRLFGVNRLLDRRGSPPERKEWHMSPATVNAYYTSQFNYICFPAAILQSPFYDPKLPTVVNFGSLGMVIGHELTHGFDNRGSHFDKFGNMHSWWTEASTKAFKKRTQCMVDQYSQYTIQGHKVIGATTLGENMADNGGVKTAYKALDLWKKAHPKLVAKMVGLDATEDQLFFLGFSKIWCAYYQPAYAVQALTTDVHGPSKFRINGVVSNMKEFSTAYKCPSKSGMNPVKKCEIW